MNKQEIQHRIKRYELVRECAEENLNELNIQLAEAEKLEKLDKLPEKPKLRHGDFGYNNQKPVIAITNQRGRLVMCRPTGAMDCQEANIHKTDFANSDVLGNVFDLMKGWDKPFKEWGDDRASKGIKIIRNRIEFYACTDGRCSKNHSPCSENAEEFYHELGHAIAELKQKQGD